MHVQSNTRCNARHILKHYIVSQRVLHALYNNDYIVTRYKQPN